MMRVSVVLALIAALACRCEASISIADVVGADIAAGNLDYYTQNGAGRHLMAGLIPGLNISELNIPKQTVRALTQAACCSASCVPCPAVIPL